MMKILDLKKYHMIFIFISFCLALFLASNVHGHGGRSAGQKMKENLAEWTCKTVALIAELENQQKSLQASAARLTSKELVPLNEQMIKFSNHLIDKIELCVWGTECAEYGQENGQQKWLRLSQEYDAKFRKDDIHSLCYDGKYGYRYHYEDDETEMAFRQISAMISGFPADLNTFLAQIELLDLEDDLEQYTILRGKNVVSVEKWAQIVRDLHKIMEFKTNNKGDIGVDEMVGQLGNEYGQSEIYVEYRKNVQEMLGKMREKMPKIRKQIAESGPNIYLTERPFEEAEILIVKIDKNVEITDLVGLINWLIVVCKKEILNNEFGTKFERLWPIGRPLFSSYWARTIGHRSQLANSTVDWQAFVALAKMFQLDWDEIEQRMGKLSAKDQRDIRKQMGRIKELAQIKATPIKAMFTEKLDRLDQHIVSEMEMLHNDLSDIDQHCNGPQTEQCLQIRKHFYERALRLCGLLAEFSAKFGVTNRQHIAQIGARLKKEMDALFANAWVTLKYREKVYKIKLLANKMKRMNIEVMHAFTGIVPNLEEGPFGYGNNWE